MIIVSDTSAITGLIQIHRVEILPTLYQEVVVPEEVANELQKYHAGLPSFLRILPVTDLGCFHRLCAEVDPGEAAAITLMLEGKGDVLLIDERRGRQIAQREGLTIIGVLGVLLEARRQSIIPSLATAIMELETIADFRISPQLKARALAAAGETPGQ